MRACAIFNTCFFLVAGTTATAPAADAPVKVFLLIGQSNMEGKGAINTLPHLRDDTATEQDLQQLQDESGNWRRRDDVFIRAG